MLIQEPTNGLPCDIPMIWYRWTYLVLPFYLSNSSERNYFISCLDDCSRKVASKWCERKRTMDVLDVLEEWIVINGKPKKEGDAR
jgi:hypothetical protein